MTWFQTRRNVVAFVLSALTLLLIVLIGQSLRWRYQHDSSVMLYFGYLINHFGMVPYRDFFDLNGPGSYLFQIILGWLTGYGDLGFRIADIVYLAAIGVVTWLLLSRFNRSVAWLGVIGFSLAYLVQGPIFSFEREYIMVLPIALAALISLRLEGRYRLKAFLVGLLFSIAASMKPHAALGFPFVLFYIIYEASINRQRTRRSLLTTGANLTGIALVGAAIPAAIAVYYLAVNNALPALLDLIRNYAPIYAKVGNDAAVIEKPLTYDLRNLTDIAANKLIAPWILPAALGTIAALIYEHLIRFRPQTILLAALAITYFIYPAFQGQFFSYHYLIALYFLTLLSALMLIPLSDPTESPANRTAQSLSSYLPLIAAVAVPLLMLPLWDIYGMIAVPQPAPKNGVPDTIAGYLKAHLQPGDTVLSSDWTGGGMHAMLLAGARPADKYLYDYFLYMAVSTPYVQHLRQDYLKEMIAASPRYVIQILDAARPFVTGPDTSESFPAFQAILDMDYKVVESGPLFNLYERVPATLSAASP